MDISELKKTLAGFCLATLVSGAGITLVAASSSWGGSQSGAGGTEPPKKEAGPSGWAGTQKGAVGAKEDQGKVDKSKLQPPETSTEKEPGKSGWSGSKPGAGGTKQ